MALILRLWVVRCGAQAERGNQVNNSELPINKLISKINDAASRNESFALTAEDVQILSKSIGDSFFVPVLTNEQVVELSKQGKLGSPIKPNKSD